jgi:hypothetical protein
MEQPITQPVVTAKQKKSWENTKSQKVKVWDFSFVRNFQNVPAVI